MSLGLGASAGINVLYSNNTKRVIIHADDIRLRIMIMTNLTVNELCSYLQLSLRKYINHKKAIGLCKLSDKSGPILNPFDNVNDIIDKDDIIYIEWLNIPNNTQDTMADSD